MRDTQHPFRLQQQLQLLFNLGIIPRCPALEDQVCVGALLQHGAPPRAFSSSAPFLPNFILSHQYPVWLCQWLALHWPGVQSTGTQQVF
jgi:hypothetical protein